jgi:hypothetical protein
VKAERANVGVGGRGRNKDVEGMAPRIAGELCQQVGDDAVDAAAAVRLGEREQLRVECDPDA